ncbi:iron complex transport system substrate-binding protein [Actinomyces ruminicola]|uniref:Iron complex transport system substrate-binding protein n=1 Tax=Actinomyces ruminicola TaxID=332524 RepID=A0A1H0ALK2_9ACTO|nr:iron-siderophore ABC transporter substrate-binding protein [Actinomyces ruminicola]SDN34337.1 iron complex transport system substrate-binding protein [Actinomyces ruminicola]
MTVSRKSFLLTGLAVPAAALLAACGSGSSSKTATSDAASAVAVPATTEEITVEHAFGTTTIPAGAARFTAIAWGNHDVALALDVMPAGLSRQTWGVADDSGMLEWTRQRVDELVAAGAAEPVLFDDTDGLAFEAIAETTPDVILAAYSGLSQEDYDTLSKIAPTVAYPEVPWGTLWRDMIRLDSQAMGMAEQGESLISDLEQQIADAVAAYPQIAGKSAAFFYMSESDTSTIGFYTTADPRTAFMTDLGMTIPASVQAVSEADPEAFYSDLSSENADQVADVDLMIMYGEESDLAALQADPLIGTIPAIKNGAVAFVGNGTPLSASTNPGPLSIPWGIDQYVSLIAAAADKADAASA